MIASGTVKPVVKPADGLRFASAGVVIVGAGAAGLCAALRAAEARVPVVVIERGRLPAGSTALSAGLIPAAGTRFQRAKRIADSAPLFAEDILAKAHGEAEPSLVRVVSEGAAPTVEWLADRYGFPFEVIANFNYSGHSAFRMHGLPRRSGAELIDRLRSAAEQAGIVILNNAIALMHKDIGVTKQIGKTLAAFTFVGLFQHPWRRNTVVATIMSFAVTVGFWGDFQMRDWYTWMCS
jgi:succinate dehydrogenase/fumarate reductase flavoprotein subunit